VRPVGRTLPRDTAAVRGDLPARRLPRHDAAPLGGTVVPLGTGPGLGPLTGLGVTLVLGAACAGGALLDLLLVGGPAWALAVAYLAACGYTAARVRRADWFSALVSPALAFAAAVIMLAELMPSSFGPGFLGLAATAFALLAAKAKALYLGAAVSAAILLGRRLGGGRGRR
jgi:hypothetical protein